MFCERKPSIFQCPVYTRCNCTLEMRARTLETSSVHNVIFIWRFAKKYKKPRCKVLRQSSLLSRSHFTFYSVFCDEWKQTVGKNTFLLKTISSVKKKPTIITNCSPIASMHVDLIKIRSPSHTHGTYIYTPWTLKHVIYTFLYNNNNNYWSYVRVAHDIITYYTVWRS